MRTVDTIISKLEAGPVPPLPAPRYTGEKTDSVLDVALAVADMQRHTTDEGWQLMLALGAVGYNLAGYNIRTQLGQFAMDGITDWTDVADMVKRVQLRTVVVQDPVEWDTEPGDFREPRARFYNCAALAEHPEIFTVIVRKDVHRRHVHFRNWVERVGAHAVINYYHPKIVCHLAGYVRPEHYIRTWHTVDKDAVPPYTDKDRAGCLLSGALGARIYPLRTNLWANVHKLPQTHPLPHPGYHNRGTCTPSFLRSLSNYKVAICTSSIFGYALRKHVEATACGCRVITDLPVDDVWPGIDNNFVRIDSDTSPEKVGELIRELIATYDPEFQAEMAKQAIARYDFRAEGQRLANEIEALRRSYNG